MGERTSGSESRRSAGLLSHAGWISLICRWTAVSDSPASLTADRISFLETTHFLCPVLKLATVLNVSSDLVCAANVFALLHRALRVLFMV